MSAHTTNLFLLQELEDSGRTMRFADGDLKALRTVAHWIETFIATPNEHIGRTGPVCPFVPQGLERKTIWLAPERISDRNPSDVVALMDSYKELLLDAPPVDGNDATYKAIVVVFTDLSADQAKGHADAVEVQNLKRLSYVHDGVVMGEFNSLNDGVAIHNPSFQPFKAPVPCLLIRQAVVSDWKFFLDNDEWLSAWARRFGESAVPALAEKLRRTNWRRLGP